MFDYINFETQEGENRERKITLLGLTTCSFCKRAKSFLDENKLGYDYLFLDKIDPEMKKRMKNEFSERYGKRLSYPTLIMENGELLTGFIRPAWEQELL
jgi:glutaredoxin